MSQESGIALPLQSRESPDAMSHESGIALPLQSNAVEVAFAKLVGGEQ